MESYWVAVGAGIVSIATLVLSGLSLRRKTDGDYVTSLEHRVEMAEESLDRCRENEEKLKGIVESLEGSNARLMSLVMKLQEDIELERLRRKPPAGG